jgi:hypothetical protein
MLHYRNPIVQLMNTGSNQDIDGPNPSSGVDRVFRDPSIITQLVAFTDNISFEPSRKIDIAFLLTPGVALSLSIEPDTERCAQPFGLAFVLGKQCMPLSF